MSDEKKSVKKANPTLIGAFVLAAFALVAFAVMALGGATLFTPKQRVVSYFEGSVKGLVEGAAVNFRGVKVGTVDRILLQFDPGSLDPRIPVYMTLVSEKVQLIGSKDDPSDIPFEAYIQRGMRAKLNIDSLVTGQLVVELDFRPDVPAVFHGTQESKVAEIPTMKSDFDVLKDQLSQLPLRQLADDVKGMVESFQVLAHGTDGALGIVGEELKSTAAATRKTLEEAQRTLVTLNKTLQSVDRTSQQAEKTLARAGPELEATLKSARGAMLRIETTMTSADAAVAQVAELTAPGAPLRADLEQSLRDLSQSAESLRHFADTVDRQPESLLFGKD